MTGHRGRRALLALTAAGSVLAAPTLLAETAATVRETVDVHVINVDVLALDRNGDPAEGLARDDFVLFVDGDKRPIDYFFAGDEQAGSLSERLSLVFFIDSVHLSQSQIEATVDEINQGLDALAGDDVSAMTVLFDGRLNMLQDLTTDLDAVRLGLRQAQTRPTPSVASRAMQLQAMTSVRETLGRLSGKGGDFRIGTLTLDGTYRELRAYGEEVYRENNATLDALNSLVDSLALVPGRKALFYVASSSVMRPLDTVTRTLQRRFTNTTGARARDASEPASGSGSSDLNRNTTGSNVMDASEFTSEVDPITTDLRLNEFEVSIAPLDLQPRFRHLAALANANRVTFYSLRPPTEEASNTVFGERPGESEDDRELSDVASGLDFLASTTGGIAMLEGSDVHGFLQRAGEVMGSYYSLGFDASDIADGAALELRLKAKPRGTRLRYRELVLTRSFASRLADRTVGSLLLGWSENAHHVNVEIESQKALANGQVAVAFTVSVPIAELTLLPEGDVYAGTVRMVVAFLTSQGERLPPQHMEIPLRIPKDDFAVAQGQLFGARVEQNLPAGTQKVAVGLWDERGQSGSFLRRDLRVRGDDEES